MTKIATLRLLATVLFAFVLTPAWPQAGPQQVYGKVTQRGTPAANVQVILTALGGTETYRAKTDSNGAFTIGGVLAGSYRIEVVDARNTVVHKEETSIGGDKRKGQTTELSIEINIVVIDTTKEGVAAFVRSLSPEERDAFHKQMQEDYEKQARLEEVQIQQAQAAMEAEDWRKAISLLQLVLKKDPANWWGFGALGDCLLNTDQYDQAVDNYRRGVKLAQADTNSDIDPAEKRTEIALMLINEGYSYFQLKKTDEALTAFAQAVVIDPSPATAYNLCATQYELGMIDTALPACDKAIQADPNKADAYFFRGSLLVAKSKPDKHGKVQALPGTVQALNRYLELAPDGEHADDVKKMLAYLGAQVGTTYKAKNK